MKNKEQKSVTLGKYDCALVIRRSEAGDANEFEVVEGSEDLSIGESFAIFLHFFTNIVTCDNQERVEYFYKILQDLDKLVFLEDMMKESKEGSESAKVQ